MKEQTCIRTKGIKSTIGDVSSKLNSRLSYIEVEVQEFTPQKFVRQLAKSQYVTYFDLGASQPIFYQKHPFICDIDAFDNLSTLNSDFWAFINCGLSKKW